MKIEEIIIRICGGPGDGSLAAGQILNKACALMGYHVFNFDSFPAEIRGFGKSVAHTRIGKETIYTQGESADCLVSLNDTHGLSELGSLKKGGILIFDSTYSTEQKVPGTFLQNNEKVSPKRYQVPFVPYSAPLRELSLESTQATQSRNMVALGILAKIFGISEKAFEQSIQTRFASKSKKAGQNILAAFRIGYQFANKNPIQSSFLQHGSHSCVSRNPKEASGSPLEPAPEIPASAGMTSGTGMTDKTGMTKIEVLSGNEAAARACLDAKVRLFAGYPITPATKIMEILAKELPKQNGVVVQTEDEISALGHVIGAAFTGQRAVTSTSGPGLALMTELLNLAVMSELPLVVIDCQRGGPSTGLPTKTEQSDLNLAIFGGSGDSPRAVLAPTNVEECYSLTLKAFELAEAFQTPVLLLLDAFLANRMEDVRWKSVSPKRFGSYRDILAKPGGQPYARFKLTETGVSPRAWPGTEGLCHTITGLEHDEIGLPRYSAEIHEKMSAKRALKMENLCKAWPAPEPIGGKGKLDVGIISWGSSVGAVREAIADFSRKGWKIGGLFPRLLWPTDVASLRQFSARSKILIVAEMNQGQFTDIVEKIVHRDVAKIARVLTEPFPTKEMERAIEKIAARGSS